jgi:hypothetical protein
MKRAKASASEGDAPGLMIRIVSILEDALTGGSIFVANHRPTNPGSAGRRLKRPAARARFAGSFIALR